MTAMRRPNPLVITTCRQYRLSSRLLGMRSSKDDGPMKTAPDTRMHQESCKLKHVDDFRRGTACKGIKVAEHYHGGDLVSVFL